MNAKKQYGKGLSGFFVGLLLATAVIAGVLYFLNKNGQSSVKELPKVEEKKVPEPEILVPGSTSSSSASATGAGSASQTQADLTSPETTVSETTQPKDTPATVEQTEKDKTAEAPQTTASETAKESVTHPPVIVAPPKPKVSVEKEKAAKEAQKQAQLKKQAEMKKAQAERTKKEAKTKTEPKVQPTPEQILNSGNLEKARKEAQTEARKKAEADADRKRAEDALSGRSGSDKQSSKTSSQPKQESGSAKGGKMIIQAGSYNNQQAAEVQRGKLAMAGVSASVVEAEVNGKTVYRVQTGVLSGSEAAAARKKLQQRGINHFARSVK